MYQQTDVQGSPGNSEDEHHMAMAGRKDWVQADLRCLMCGRIIGRLVGPLPAGEPATRTLAGRPPQFAAFRPSDPHTPATRLVGGEHFRCSTCGGAVIMDELETFSTYTDVDEDLEERPRRGRPPKPWRRPATPPTWFETLGIAG
jgi:DNA-directed RNA polymerase subunit N (RpoN/RPB10)